jgi:predicted phosphoribosyltransferase
MPFDDRNDAGRRLAQALAHYCGQRPLVLAIPRGAVPMGRLLAEQLGGDLDVVMVRKIGAPHQPEFALAAIDEGGGFIRIRNSALPNNTAITSTPRAAGSWTPSVAGVPAIRRGVRRSIRPDAW